MRLIPIQQDKYEEYRYDLMFDCYKWDPQFLDSNTIAKYALVITKKEHEEIKKLTEKRLSLENLILLQNSKMSWVRNTK